MVSGFQAVWFLAPDGDVLRLSEWVADPLGLKQASALQTKTRSPLSFKTVVKSLRLIWQILPVTCSEQK